MCEPVDVAKAHEILARFRPIAPKPLQLSRAAAPPVDAASRPRKRSSGRSHLPPSSKRQKPPAAPLFAPLSLSLHPPRPPVERDLLRKLQEPKIIAPRAVRPVGSSITVGSITSASSAGSPSSAPPKKAAEVEEEVESEAVPAVVSDCNNRVRLVNAAYKELVGQPECMWLDSCMGRAVRTHSSRRINGEVMLDFSGSPATWSGGFSCRVKIEWVSEGRKAFIDAPCDVRRLHCESKDYLFTWRFRTAEAYYRTDCMSFVPS